MQKLKYDCSTIDILLQESEQKPKVKPAGFSTPAQIGDLAWVMDENKEFIFTNTGWVPHIVTEEAPTLGVI